MLKYLNDTGADVELKLPPREGEDLPTKITVKAGDEVEITDDVAKYFLNYDLQATKTEEKPEGEPEDETEPAIEPEEKAEAKEESEEEAAEEKAEEALTDAAKQAEEPEVKEVKLSEAEAKLAEERAKLEEDRRALAEEKAERQFEKYVAEGKATPAQKNAFMALSLHEGTIRVAEGKEESVSELLKSLFESAAQHSLYEEEGVDGEGKEEPELTDEEKEVAETFGNSEEDIKAIKNEGK